MVGASGAIFGLFGACLVLVRRLGLDPQYLIGIIAINFILTFSIPNISKLGHLGGFVVALRRGTRDRRVADDHQPAADARQSAGLGGVLVVSWWR